MAAISAQIMTNRGTVLNIKTMGYSANPEGYCYARGNKLPPATVFEYMPDSFMPITATNGYFSDISGWNDLEYYESEEIQAKMDLIDSEVRWIWGSLAAGGAYIRKVAGPNNVDAYRIGGVTGFFHRLADDKYTFLMTEASRNYYRDSNNGIELMFAFDTGAIEYQNPIISVWSINDMDTNEGTGGDLTWYGWKTYNQLIADYGVNRNCTNLHDPTRYITYEGTLGDKPSMLIVPQYSGISYPYALKYNILGALDSQIVGLEKISGSIYGDAEQEEEEDPNEDGGYSESGGGGGSYPYDTGNVDFSDPTQMTTDVISSGFAHLYNPSAAEMKSFNNWLFNDVTDAMSSIFKKLIADPIDYILFAALCHFTPPSTVTDSITFAGVSSDVVSNVISKQFVGIDCGTVNMQGDTQTFLDYNPNTKISIYLPYIGIQQLNPDDIVGSNVHIKYFIDLLTGGCICQIKCSRSLRNNMGDAMLNDVMYTFSGNCFEQIPITGTDWRGLATSLMSAASGAVSLATGNLAGAGAIASAVMSDKVSVQHSGNAGASFGYMDNQKPYFMIERPINNNPHNFKGWKGYTSNLRMKLSMIKGYTEIDDNCMWVDNFDGISKDEADKLKSVLASGVYF